MDELKLSQSTVAGILRRLEDKGLIERTCKDGDARTSIIRSTEQGEQLRSQLRRSAIRDERELLSDLTEDERDAFRTMLGTVLEHMERIKEEVGRQ